MKRSLRILQGVLVPATVLAFAAVALCAEEGGNPAEQSTGTVFKWIHFAILAIVGYWLFQKVLPPVFRRKADKISAAIAKATAAKAEAEKQLKRAAVKLASLEEEVAQFRAQAQKEAAAEMERLRAMTKIDAEKISLAAKAEIEAAERAASGAEGAGGKTGGRPGGIAGGSANDTGGARSDDQSFRAKPAGEAELKSASLQYANALADIVLQQGAAEPARKQLEDFRAAHVESAELRNFLASPAVTREAKHGVIEKLAARLGASKIIRNFLFVIVDNQRVQLLPEIVESFEEVLRQREGVAEAEVASAVELNDGQKTVLVRTLERLTGKKIQAKYALEPELVGGTVVRIGDTIYDGSVRNRLNQLRARLTAE